MADLNDVIQRINNLRAQNGMSPLTVSSQLMSLAAAKAEDHKLGGYPNSNGPCAHVSPRLGSPIDQARAAGYFYYPIELYTGKTGAIEYSSEEAVNSWLGSPCHEPWITSNFVVSQQCGIVNPAMYKMVVQNLTHIGVGYFYDSTTMAHHWVLIMANERQRYTSNSDPYREDCPTTPQNGWVEQNGTWYYYVNGNRQTGWIQIGSSQYYFDNAGAFTGWAWYQGTWYFWNGSWWRWNGTSWVPGTPPA
ncbi:CAP domain-containing protein [Priestia aryabhattai]|uniref:CAP domain-containing protein n=1 Tax=Priestia aryabhattai TaxID=412384 RepID=UPI00373662C6